MKTDVLGLFWKRTLCTPTKNTVHTDTIHLPRDFAVFLTGTPGPEESNTSENKYRCLLPLSEPGFHTFPPSYKESCYMTQTFQGLPLLLLLLFPPHVVS